MVHQASAAATGPCLPLSGGPAQYAHDNGFDRAMNLSSAVSPVSHGVPRCPRCPRLTVFLHVVSQLSDCGFSIDSGLWQRFQPGPARQLPRPLPNCAYEINPVIGHNPLILARHWQYVAPCHHEGHRSPPGRRAPAWPGHPHGRAVPRPGNEIAVWPAGSWWAHRKAMSLPSARSTGVFQDLPDQTAAAEKLHEVEIAKAFYSACARFHRPSTRRCGARIPAP